MSQQYAETIVAKLRETESAEDVRVFYACESGSRAWGFASPDSDYDVRFLYVHRPDWYLSVDVERRRDVIELPVVDHLDVNGWDLRKALYLMYKSNPPLMEWLGSPIVYLSKTGVPAKLRALADRFYQPQAAAHHYLQMARNNYREFLVADEVKLKKYFYVLRPLLAVRWIERDLGIVPTPFDKLVAAAELAQDVLAAIEDLLKQKAETSEMGTGPRIDVLNDLIDSEFERHAASPFSFDRRPADLDALNELFRQALREVWPE